MHDVDSGVTTHLSVDAVGVDCGEHGVHLRPVDLERRLHLLQDPNELAHADHPVAVSIKSAERIA